MANTANADFATPAASDFELSNEQQEAFDKIEVDEDGFIRLSEITHRIFREQVQYISFHFDGSADRVILVEDLRVSEIDYRYHGYKIHKDDALTFIARYRAHRRSEGHEVA